jgi:nitrite reductase/ring-hydroxylating ferredoxin subunit
VHGASFRIETGLCIGGPCKGEHLRRVGVEVVDEAVMLVDVPSARVPD